MTIDNTQDVIDSREIIDRIAELEAKAAEGDSLLDADERIELASLKALAAQGSDYSEDWQYGATLIHDSYFVTYARELADDIGAIPADAAWPLTCIDWDEAAAQLQIGYVAIDFDGVTYWAR